MFTHIHKYYIHTFCILGYYTGIVQIREGLKAMHPTHNILDGIKQSHKLVKSTNLYYYGYTDHL